jgi:hypothetical protein
VKFVHHLLSPPVLGPTASGPILTFASLLSGHFCEC